MTSLLCSVLLGAVGLAWLPVLSGTSSPRWLAALLVGGAALLLGPVRMSSGHWLGLAAVAWAAATAAWSPFPHDVAGGLVPLAALAAAFVLGARDDLDLRPAWVVLGIAAGVNGAVAAAQLSGLDVLEATRVQAGEPAGMMGNKNFLAHLAALSVAALLFQVGRSRVENVALACSAATLAITTSRGAWLALAVAGAATRIRRERASWWLLTPLALAAVLLLWADSQVNPARLAGSLGARIDQWDWALTNWSWVGWGLGSYGSALPWEHAQNELMEVGFESGVVGVVLVSVFAVHLLRSEPSAEWAVLACFLVSSATSSVLHQPATAVVAAVVAGRISGSLDRRRLPGPGGGVHGDLGAAIPRPQHRAEDRWT